MHVRTRASWACATPVGVDHTASLRLGETAEQNRGACKDFWKLTPSREATCNAMLKEALLLQAGVAHARSYLRWRGGGKKSSAYRLSITPGDLSGAGWGGGHRRRAAQFSHINRCWSQEKKQNPLWQEYLQCMWVWACRKWWWKESRSRKAGWLSNLLEIETIFLYKKKEKRRRLIIVVETGRHSRRWGRSPGGEDYRWGGGWGLHRRGGERGCMQMEGRAPRTGTVFGLHLRTQTSEGQLHDNFSNNQRKCSSAKNTKKITGCQRNHLSQEIY